MYAYVSGMKFEDYMERRNEIHATREEAISKNAIDALLKVDLALSRLPLLSLPGTHTKEDVTTSWFTANLGAAVPGANIEQVVIRKEHSGMTDLRLLELKWNEKGSQAGLPGSIFVKATPTSLGFRESLAAFRMSAIEVRFYQTVRPELPNLAPAAYYARSYPGGRFLLLHQDLNANRVNR